MSAPTTEPPLAREPRRGLVGRYWAPVPYVLTAALLGWVFADADLAAFYEALRTANPVRVLVVLGVTASVMAALDALSVSWLCQRLFPGVSRWRLARVRLGMQLLNTTHFAAGQGGFGLYLARCCNRSLGAASSTVVVIIVGTLLGLVGLELFAILLDGRENVPPEVYGFAVVSSLIALTWQTLWSVYRKAGLRWALFEASSWFAFRALSSRDLALFVAMRVLILVVSMFGQYLGFGMFGPQIALPAFAARWPVVQVIIGLPISVAGIGTGQLAWLHFFDDHAGRPQILAFSLVWGVGHAITSALIGAPFLRGALADLASPPARVGPDGRSTAEAHPHTRGTKEPTDAFG